MRYKRFDVEDEVIKWCNQNPSTYVVSITYNSQRRQYIIFYENYSIPQPSKIAAHNIDPGFAIPSTGSPMPTAQYPSTVCACDGAPATAAVP